MKLSAVAAVLASLVAASLWFLSSNIKIEFGAYGGMSPADRKKLSRQSKLNSAAALLTGVATLLQGLAMLPS
jgi:hypothetical protein